jgi:SAM-dependent methyltransferase
MSDALEDSRNFWDGHARRDPLWAILSESAKKDGKWGLGRFFQTGVAEISSLFYEIDSRRVPMSRGSALDFGCGVGRLTQALAPHFDRVVGVDISPNMVQLATGLNRFPDNVSYVWNQAPHLQRFGDAAFDFVVSNIVLQHIPPEMTLRYLEEFFRVLAPGGILVFQLPSHRRRPDDPAPPQSGRVMPDDAYRASIAVFGVPGKALMPGSEVTLDVEVTNTSAFEWSQREFGVIRVGNHWLDGAGDRMLQRDDGRTSLPGALQPGDSCRLPLTIKTPPDEGVYQCEIDVVHEGVLWFHDRGSPVARFVLGVAPQAEADTVFGGEAPASPTGRRTDRVSVPPDQWTDAPAPAGLRGDADDPGDFPMYAVDTNIVTGLIARHGGMLLQIENDRSCGEDWVSYRYFVRRSQEDYNVSSSPIPRSDARR